jgi:hypothetical protein
MSSRTIMGGRHVSTAHAKCVACDGCTEHADLARTCIERPQRRQRRTPRAPCASSPTRCAEHEACWLRGCSSFPQVSGTLWLWQGILRILHEKGVALYKSRSLNHPLQIHLHLDCIGSPDRASFVAYREHTWPCRETALLVAGALSLIVIDSAEASEKKAPKGGKMVAKGMKKSGAGSGPSVTKASALASEYDPLSSAQPHLLQ